MCKVIGYEYACWHGFTLCASRCGGHRIRPTRNKRTDGTARVACCGKPYIMISLKGDCSHCLLEAWIQKEKSKLSKATDFKNKFLADQRDRNNMSLSTISVYTRLNQLVNELEEEFSKASWRKRREFPPPRELESTLRLRTLPRAAATRNEVVNSPEGKFQLEYRCARPSNLRYEVQPEDIEDPLPSEVPSPDDQGWITYDGNEEWYENYEPSTDPWDPIITNYDDVPLFASELDSDTEDDDEGAEDNDGEEDNDGAEGLVAPFELMMSNPGDRLEEENVDSSILRAYQDDQEAQRKADKVFMDKVVEDFWSAVNSIDDPQPQIYRPPEFTPRLNSYERYRRFNRRVFGRTDPRRYYNNHLLIWRLEIKSVVGGAKSCSIHTLEGDVDLEDIKFRP